MLTRHIRPLRLSGEGVNLNATAPQNILLIKSAIISARGRKLAWGNRWSARGGALHCL